jgi:hypothetical protein
VVFSRRNLGVAATALLVLGTLLLAACGSTAPALTSSPPTSPTVSGAIPSLAELPVGEPVDMIRRTSAPYVWNAVLADRIVAYVESDSYGFLQPGQAQQPTQLAAIKTLDLETGNVSAVPGGELSSPKSFSIWPWWFLKELPALKGEDTGPSFIWALGNTQYSRDGIERWEELTGWNPSAGTKALLDSEAMTRPPIRTGDVLALPLTSPAYETAQGARVEATIGEKLLLLNGSLDDPIPVDPTAPMLSSAALAGISPYVSWSGRLLGRRPPAEDAPQFRDDLPGKPPRVFDLRSGSLVDIAVQDPRPPDSWMASVVAGHWAAWVAIESDSFAGSLYLADLSTGRAERLLEGDVPRQIGLSEDWLLWTDPSGNLVGYHLPDLTPVLVPEVLAPGEYDFDQNLQISGDLALFMVVAPDPDGDAIGPSDPPKWTAIRVVRLR